MGARMPGRRPIAAAAGLLAVWACTSVNPATGRREIVLMSPADERAIDEKAAEQIEAQLGIVANPELAAYIQAIGDALAEHSPRHDVDYVFQVVEAEEPNAFALPGGHVYVSRGLLTVANSEAEIANVLGHEIGHVAARHAARQQAHVQTLGLATLLSDLLSGGAEEQPDSERISGHFVARYARNQEREADRIGQDLAIAAGVDPSGLARFMATLDNLTRITQGFSTPDSYFATHPAARERMLEATTRAQGEVWRAPIGERREWKPGLPVATTREEFLDRIEGIAVGRPASEGVFVGERFLHPDLDFSLRFPHGWKLDNQSSQVVGLSPRRDGVVLLQLDSPGEDPVAAARAYAEREQLHLENGEAIRVGGLPGFRAEAVVPTSYGMTHAEITWIAHAGRVYRLIAGIEPGTLPKYGGVFRKFSHSFRPLLPEERAEITELRLRTAVVQPGESVEAFAERTGNEWNPFYTAVVNGLAVGSPLPSGARLKIARREPYAPAAREPEAPVGGGAGPEPSRTLRTASTTSRWIAPLVATMPRFASSVRPRPKSSGRPSTSLTTPPAHSTTRLPAAWSQIFSR
jgi:predicted Zn-dependent protease